MSTNNNNNTASTTGGGNTGKFNNRFNNNNNNNNNNNRYNNKFNNNNNNNRYNNNRYNNNSNNNNKYNNYHHNNYHHHNQPQVQPLKIAKEQILELNNYINDTVEVYIGKNLKMKGKLLSYDLDNLDMVLDESVLYILKDLTILSDEEEAQLLKERETMENPFEDIYDDKIDYGISMVKGNMIISFNKAI